MPRECSSRHDTAPLRYGNDAYLDDNADSYPRSQSDTSSSPSSPVQPLNPKKKHYCTVCGRSFTTSGHLARHSRVHTGERNHICPFPGCQTRCSRQDNLQQQ
ncbi:hypothetical protein GLOTRDRAFT_33579 [Gloeophyllum trabeum ATCC 11539]|uniref:C2H2-type domain-containing protein n=1 Tax=Gloeophyllum trabeum (strain ATCC 11539 / FP-39264 / Madison 617) TaxID=670483 RepID=S7QHP6_GLOTA|nr:uncharacterized protein GLOTRDRAFT_33579 [Gloeophyllum trabeum ATCC 11539]EPQ58768.1 hypothetical protein GLOTRDRAFT_33579 [Gloeophyllum trabeum ATCC 11539]